MLGLGKDAGPGIEKGRGIGDRLGHCLDRISALLALHRVERLHTFMFPLERSRVSMTPSMDALMLRTPSSSFLSAASWSNSSFWFDGVLGVRGVLGRSLGGAASLSLGEAQMSSVMEASVASGSAMVAEFAGSVVGAMISLNGLMHRARGTGIYFVRSCDVAVTYRGY